MILGFSIKYPWLDTKNNLISPSRIGYTFEEFLDIIPTDFVSIFPEVKDFIIRSIRLDPLTPKTFPDVPDHVIFFTMLCFTVACIKDKQVFDRVINTYVKFASDRIKNDTGYIDKRLNPDRLSGICRGIGWNFEANPTQIKSELFDFKIKITEYLPMIKEYGNQKLLPDNLTHDEKYIYLVIPDILSWLEHGCQKQVTNIICSIQPNQISRFRGHTVFGQIIAQIETIIQKTKAEQAQVERTESKIEEIFWNNVKNEIPGVYIQYWIGIYRVDFAIPDLKIAIECYSQEFHSSAMARTKDAERERILHIKGWRIIHFTGTEIKHDVQKCVRDLKKIVVSHGSRNLQKQEPKIIEEVPKSAPESEFPVNSEKEQTSQLSIADLIRKHIVRELYSTKLGMFPSDLYSTIKTYAQNRDILLDEYKKTLHLAKDLFQARLGKIRHLYRLPPDVQEFQLNIRNIPDEEKIFASKVQENVSTWYQMIQDSINGRKSYDLQQELQDYNIFLQFRNEFGIITRTEKECYRFQTIPLELYSRTFASMNYWKKSDNPDIQEILKKLGRDFIEFLSLRFKKLLNWGFIENVAINLPNEEKILVVSISNLYTNWINERFS